MYYEGRRVRRENAKFAGGSVIWPLPTRWSDWWLKWLTGYGVYTWRLLLPISFFIILGTVVFWPEDALLPVTPATTNTYEGQNLDVLVRHFFDRFAFSTARFLPIIDLYIADKWEPNGLWREAYVFLHSLVGWILVPLLITSLAGIVKRT
jgi:hypothetical protein